MRWSESTPLGSGLVLGLMLLAATAVGCGGEGGAPASAPPAEPDTPSAPVASGPRGTVSGSAPPAALGSPSVVILEPHVPIDVPVPTEPVEMDQLGREFIPRLVLARPDQPIVFYNSEDDLHTVHVHDPSGRSLFNVAMPIRGGRHDTSFSTPGDYPVSCEAHSEMAATIVVVESPWATIADRDGSFTIPDVPTGTYTLVLRRNEERHEQELEVTPGANELQLAFPAGS